MRVGKDGKRLHAWLDPAGEELLFSRTGQKAVGSQYTVRVTRDDTITVHGTPEYAGTAAGEDTRRALWTGHTLAQIRPDRPRQPPGPLPGVSVIPMTLPETPPVLVMPRLDTAPI